MGVVVKQIFVLVLIVNLSLAQLQTTRRPQRFEDVSQDCIKYALRERSGVAYLYARKEILGSPSAHGEIPKGKACENIHGRDWGASLYFIDGKAVSYEYVFKGNSENIHSAFASREEQPKRFRTWSELREYYVSSSLGELKQKAKDKYHADDVKVFTFMRDPLSHFISGLVESHFRSFGINDRNISNEHLAETIKSNQVDSKFARKLLDELIVDSKTSRQFLKDHLTDCSHFSVQSYSLIKWQPHVIGYLENFKDDWQRVIQFIGLNITYREKPPEMTHPTIGDPMHLKASLLEVLHRFPNYMRAVCRLIMVDYVCLRFPLPRECGGMMPTNYTEVRTRHNHSISANASDQFVQT